MLKVAPLHGPSERARLDRVAAWIDAWAAPLAAESMSLADAAGRVAAGDVRAELDLPPFDRAAADGFALQADETVGASAYNPLPFRLQPASTDAGAGCAVQVESGAPLPAGADAVVRLEHATRAGAGTIAVIAAVFAGQDIERAGDHAKRGSVLVAAGRQLEGGTVGLLASTGRKRVSVVGRPRVRCLLAADGVSEPGGALLPGAVYDANGPMLAALIARDGGVVVQRSRIGRDRARLREALALPGADVVLVAGGTGLGPGDVAAAVLAEAGELAVHGIALRPGESAGAGRAAGGPVFLLPGTPAACLWAYELLAGRAIRRLAGLGAELPFPSRALRMTRKIVSEVGTVEVWPVHRTGEGEAEPLAPFSEAGLVAATQADGFVVVPEASEGYPAGATVTVYLHSRSR
ncbi:MAG TPA: molybdopterin molybdotransferase MoeA [Hyphomicrobiaceae bacterium]|jgi:molybdopterin molybdotransferase